ncbi:AMP-binding protein [Bradyrhizobium sp. SZCCHNPS1003]|uniref:AMP-binding protein n=1 Tax=Bradyrhizobium sp. SZCCHNPS1003 TaxID=3057330 RepID=UPI0028EBC424|nr:AMP-binding protein [Bradyrhizobium sp. SZCCHNPS1003]
MSAPGVSDLAGIEAIEQEAPLAVRLPHASIWQAFKTAARRHADKVAVSFLAEGRHDGRVDAWTYDELWRRSEAVAHWLTSVASGERSIGLLLANVPEFYCAYLGGQIAGIPCPINPALPPHVAAAIVQGAGCQALVVEGPTRNPAVWQNACGVAAESPGLRHVLVIGDGGEGMPDGVTVTTLEDVVAAAASAASAPGAQLTHESPAARFHTGGTTGAPKIATHSHGNQLYEAWAVAHLVGFNSSDVVLVGLPLFHVHAVIPLSLAPLLQGAQLVLLGAQGFRHPDVIGGFWRIVERFRATAFSAVPTVYAALLAVDPAGADTSSLRFALCGSAPLPQRLLRDFETRTGLTILEGYGLTEGTCVSSLNPVRGPRRIGSIGLRLPYQQMQVARLDDEGRRLRDCACGETGEILISGPNVFRGYTDPDLTQKAFAAPGWLATGDLGHVDAEGFFWISGRSKDLIKRSGHSVDPRAVEESLLGHPAVAAAAVVARPDPRAGEVPFAFVTLRDNAARDQATLLAQCRLIVNDPISAPVDLRIVGALPLTAVGKIDKVKLRDMAAATQEETSR